MVFSELTFLFLFLPLSFVYFFVPKKFQNLVLFIFGIIYYMWGEPKYVVCILWTICMDYVLGRLMEKYGTDSPKKRKFFLVLSLTINLGILGVFKYSGMIIETINRFLGTSIPNPNLPLPVGVSFYTFQSMSYIIDLYRGKYPAQKSLINYGSYISMYPQLVAGPIVPYESIEKELRVRTINFDLFSEGIVQFIGGLAKKVLLADTIGSLWNTIKAIPQGELSVGMSWLGIVAYTFQIYFDFSGYSQMAIGLGKTMGFHFPPNFDYPYMSKSISEFWRRWHMTLGGWFKNYVYIPLGGNRHGTAKTIRNTLIVWALTGLWHGASWNFMFWGLYFGVIIIIEKFFLGKYLEKLPKFLSGAYTMLLVMLGWVLFENNTVAGIFGYLKAMFGGNKVGIFDGSFKYYLSSYLILLVIAGLCSTSRTKNFIFKLKEKNAKIFNILYILFYVILLFITISYMVDSTFSPFLYFRF